MGHVLRAFPDSILSDGLNDVKYLALTEDGFRGMAHAAIDVSNIIYHGESEEFPDCDDYARIAQGQVLRHAVINGFDYAPAFFFVALKPKLGANHAQNLALTTTGVMIYEPQNGRWTRNLDYIQEITSLEG